MNYDELEFHDARLGSTLVSYPDNTVTLQIEYYATEQSRERLSALLRFHGVSFYSENTNFNEMADNASAGNISYWVPSAGIGMTYIYLVRGFICITAQRIELINNA